MYRVQNMNSHWIEIQSEGVSQNQKWSVWCQVVFSKCENAETQTLTVNFKPSYAFSACWIHLLCFLAWFVSLGFFTLLVFFSFFPAFLPSFLHSFLPFLVFGLFPLPFSRPAFISCFPSSISFLPSFVSFLNYHVSFLFPISFTFFLIFHVAFFNYARLLPSLWLDCCLYSPDAFTSARLLPLLLVDCFG